jgi:DNA-3-methyladenine glycosylase
VSGAEPHEIFERPSLEVAPRLLGGVLTHDSAAGSVSIRLTEVEAYGGWGSVLPRDPGSHAYRGLTQRNRTMFGPPANLYVYFTYGMHWCANLVCEVEGLASAVLLRAGEVVDGEHLARFRRPACGPSRDLARGPARLAACLGLSGKDDGRPVDVVIAAQGGLPLTLRLPGGADVERVRQGPRVGVSGPGGDGAAFPWRFWLDGEPTVSGYRPGRKI